MSAPFDLIDHKGPISSLAYSKSRLVSTSLDKTIRIWNIQERSALPINDTPGRPRILVSSPHHDIFIVVYENHIEVRDGLDGGRIARLLVVAKSVAFTPDGSEFITGSQELGLQIWDLKTLRDRRPDGMVEEVVPGVAPLYGLPVRLKNDAFIVI